MLAGVMATVASTTSSGLAATRWKARSVKGMMWLGAKKGMRRMRIFLPCLMEAILAIGLCLNALARTRGEKKSSRLLKCALVRLDGE
jgi:hypothetical protein